jgi:type I restriction enzyme M protein
MSKEIPLEQLTTAERLGRALKSARRTMRSDKGLNGDLDRLPILTWLMFLKFLDDLETQRQVDSELAGERYEALIEAPYRWRDWAIRPDPTGDDLLAFISSDEVTNPLDSASNKKIPGLFAYLRDLSSSNSTDDSRKDVVATVFAGIDNRMKSGYLLREVIAQIDKIHFDSSDELQTLGALYEGMLREMRDAAGDSGEFYTPRSVVRFMVEATNPRLGETVLDPACGTGGFLVEAFSYMARQVSTVQDRRILQSHSIIGGEPKSLPYLLCQMNLILHGLDAPNIDPHNSLRFKLTEIGDRDRVDLILTNPPFGGEEERGIQGNFPPDRQTSETALLFLQLIMRRLKREGKGRAAVVVPNTTLFDTGVASRIREDLLRQFHIEAIVRLPKGVFEPYTDIETNLIFFDTRQGTDEILFYELPLPEGRAKYTKTAPLRYDELAEALAVLGGEIENSVNAWRVPAEVVLNDSRRSLDLRNPSIARSTAEAPTEVANKLMSGLQTLSQLGLGLDEILREAADISARSTTWVEITLGELLSRRKDVVEVEDDVIYKRLRIQSKGRGILVRDEIEGSKIGTKRQFQVASGMFVLSKIDARNGAFGLVPDEGDGAIITGNFWAYDHDPFKIVPKLLVHLTRSDAFIDFCRLSSPGMTNRRYLQEDLFLKQVMRIPQTTKEQELVCRVLDYVETVAHTFERDLKRLSGSSEALLQSTLHLVFGGSERTFDDTIDGSSSEAED